MTCAARASRSAVTTRPLDAHGCRGGLCAPTPRRLQQIIVLMIRMQLLAYQAAVTLGLDIAKPRSLATSVTVG